MHFDWLLMCFTSAIADSQTVTTTATATATTVAATTAAATATTDAATYASTTTTTVTAKATTSTGKLRLYALQLVKHGFNDSYHQKPETK